MHSGGLGQVALVATTGPEHEPGDCRVRLGQLEEALALHVLNLRSLEAHRVPQVGPGDHRAVLDYDVRLHGRRSVPNVDGCCEPGSRNS